MGLSSRHREDQSERGLLEEQQQDATGGGLLSLTNLALPAQALATALVGLKCADGNGEWCPNGSQQRPVLTDVRLVFEAVTVLEWPDVPAMSGTVTSGGSMGFVLDPPNFSSRAQHSQ